MDTKVSWHEACIEDIENTNLSYGDLALKYGRSRTTIIKLRHRYNLTRKVPRARDGQMKTQDKSSLSSRHRALGSRLTVFRANRNYTQVSEELGVSRRVVRLMELGAHDFTLSQLTRIADILQMDLTQLITPIQTFEVRRVDPTKDRNAD